VRRARLGSIKAGNGPGRAPASIFRVRDLAGMARGPTRRGRSEYDAGMVDTPTYIGGMCNDYEQQVRWGEYCKIMQAVELRVVGHQGEADLPQADDIRINDIGPVMRASGDEVELVPMSFSFAPQRSGGAPVFNFRSEGRHFANSSLASSRHRRSSSSRGRNTPRRSTDLRSRILPSPGSLPYRGLGRATSRRPLRC